MITSVKRVAANGFCVIVGGGSKGKVVGGRGSANRVSPRQGNLHESAGPDTPGPNSPQVVNPRSSPGLETQRV